MKNFKLLALLSIVILNTGTAFGCDSDSDSDAPVVPMVARKSNASRAAKPTPPTTPDRAQPSVASVLPGGLGVRGKNDTTPGREALAAACAEAPSAQLPPRPKRSVAHHALDLLDLLEEPDVVAPGNTGKGVATDPARARLGAIMAFKGATPFTAGTEPVAAPPTLSPEALAALASSAPPAAFATPRTDLPTHRSDGTRLSEPTPRFESNAELRAYLKRMRAAGHIEVAPDGTVTGTSTSVGLGANMSDPAYNAIKLLPARTAASTIRDLSDAFRASRGALPGAPERNQTCCRQVWNFIKSYPYGEGALALAGTLIGVAEGHYDDNDKEKERNRCRVAAGIIAGIGMSIEFWRYKREANRLAYRTDRDNAILNVFSNLTYVTMLAARYLPIAFNFTDEERYQVRNLVVGALGGISTNMRRRALLDDGKMGACVAAYLELLDGSHSLTTETRNIIGEYAPLPAGCWEKSTGCGFAPTTAEEGFILPHGHMRELMSASIALEERLTAHPDDTLDTVQNGVMAYHFYCGTVARLAGVLHTLMGSNPLFHDAGTNDALTFYRMMHDFMVAKPRP